MFICSCGVIASRGLGHRTGGTRKHIAPPGAGGSAGGDDVRSIHWRVAKIRGVGSQMQEPTYVPEALSSLVVVVPWSLRKRFERVCSKCVGGVDSNKEERYGMLA